MRAFIYLTLFDYYRYIANPELTHSDSSPCWISIFVYDSGRIRISRDADCGNIDSWYSSFEEIAPILDVMLANDRYILRPEPKVYPPYVLSPKVRARHAAYLSAVPADERKRKPYYSWLAWQPLKEWLTPVRTR